jgi:hypothetical protein
MLSIAELAHKRDPQAIAEIIRQELQVLGADYFDTEVAIIDSSLELQIRTNSSIDKETILTLAHSKLHNLHIESVAKFKVYCWRKDDETHEQHLLWTEQFMAESLKLSLSHTSELQSDNLADPKLQSTEVNTIELQSTEVKPIELQSTETQLSKNSVLQRAINKLSSNNPKAKTYLQAVEKQEIIFDRKSSLLNITSPNRQEQAQLSFQSNKNLINENWQLLLVGLSIVLLGLGIGAFARAVTSKISTEPNPAIPSNAVIDKSSQPSSQNSKSQTAESVGTRQSAPTGSQKNLSSSPIATETTSTSNINTSPSFPSKASQEEEKTITLEKFNLVQKGMTVEQVEKIFGVSGKVIAENTMNDTVGKVYSWKNPQGSNAIIEFKNGQVVAKAQAGL